MNITTNTPMNITTNTHHLIALLALILLLSMASILQAGTNVPWNELPEAVRATVLSNGGEKNQNVDLEKHAVGGMALYEAGVVGKDGSQADLMITADGKLIKTKHDDTADAREEKAGKKKKVAVVAEGFTHPRDITHPYLPLSSLKQDILVGGKGGKERVVRTVAPGIHKTFKIGAQKVDALTVVDKETIGGKVAEITRDYFAQDDAGNVYYLGEDVDTYKDGRIVGHEGAWLLGKETQKPGLLLPADITMKKAFRSEDVPNVTTEKDRIVSKKARVQVPAGTFTDCIKIEEHASDGATEFKYFAKGIGCVKEEESDGSLVLQSHTTR